VYRYKDDVPFERRHHAHRAPSRMKIGGSKDDLM
jgi:hypothetical protein